MIQIKDSDWISGLPTIRVLGLCPGR